tara:strand:+ start:654 stop:1895 length:1242 start_codon:yes stop_codon:yes gene_type:complete
VTFENLNKNLRNRHTSIVADGKRFHSDIEALMHLSKKLGPLSELENRIPRYDNTQSKTLGEYHKGLGEYLSKKGVLQFDIHGKFMDTDWTTEPEHDVSVYIDRMCEAIEQNYDEIMISYSGGTDSNTITDAFLRRGTRNVKLVNFVNTSLQIHVEARKWLAKHTNDALKYKYENAIRNLNWSVQIFEAWQPYSAKQYEDSIANREFMAWNNDYNNLHSWAQNSGEIIATRNTGRRTCWIVGYEKPHLTIDNGWYCFRMSHDIMDTPLSPVDPNAELIYFWMNDLEPNLIKKLAHCKAKEIRKIFAENNTSPNKENVEMMNRSHSAHYHRLNKAMGMSALTDFLATNETKDGYWKQQDLEQQSRVLHKETEIKKTLRDKYFDEVIKKEINANLLAMELRRPISIVSKIKKVIAA